jgi:glyoxylase-like metal-dependent hydrolase (beta-lactamase superfamily II)
MEIWPGVHAVQLLGAQGYVVFEDRLTVIDAGLPGSRPLLARYLRRHGRSIDEVTRVVCTHGHPDHAGGARELASAGVEVLMHPADFEGLQVGIVDAIRRPTRGRLFASVTPSPREIVPLAHGDVIPVAGGLEVIHTPGHTPGSICLYARRDALIFVGDVLQRRPWGEVVFASAWYSDDLDASKASVQQLAGLRVEMIVFGHYPPVRQDAARVLEEMASKARVGR